MRNKSAAKWGIYQLSGIGTVMEGYRMDNVDMLDFFAAYGKRVCSCDLVSVLCQLCFRGKSMKGCKDNGRVREVCRHDRRSGALFLRPFFMLSCV